jgi:DnaJ-domain-containing protein 1
MSKHLDLDDVAATSTHAKAELDQLRARIRELETRNSDLNILSAADIARCQSLQVRIRELETSERRRIAAQIMAGMYADSSRTGTPDQYVKSAIYVTDALIAALDAKP